MSDPIKTGLWKNDPDKPPGYGGKIEIDGKQYWVNLYKNDRKTQDNHPDLNLVIKPKLARGQTRQAPADDPFDDSADRIPW